MDEGHALSADPADASTPHAPGQRISHYRIIAPLGKGGMGEVYAAEDEVLRRRVALKSIRAGLRLDPSLRARFLREARVLSQLDHPNICRIHDYVASGEGDYLVLELLAGTDLAETISAGIGRERALEIALEIASALAAAHAAGVVHRDVKPGNVMVTTEGTTKVLDFGLSHSHDPAHEPVTSPAPAAAPTAPTAPTVGGGGTLIWQLSTGFGPGASDAHQADESFHTQHGGVLGTVSYMSPEQARGELVTAASDMYSLGLVLQELFTGHPAIERTADTLDNLRRAQRAESAPVVGLDRDLTALLGELKSPDVARRPPASEVVRRLRWIRERPQRRLRRALLAAALLGVLGGAAKYTVDLRRERARAEGRTEAALGIMQRLFEEQVPVLAEVGRLDAFDAVVVGLQSYFDSVPREELTDRELAKHSRLLQLAGDVRESQGRPADAQRHFEQALAVVSELALQHPADSEILLNLGAAHFYLGQNSLRARNPAAALASFEAYRDAAKRNLAVDPDPIHAAREMAFAENAIAGTLLELGRASEALVEQQRVVDRLRELIAAGGEGAKLVPELADNLSWLGSARLGAGDVGAARLAFEEELLLRRAAAAADARNAAARASLAYCLTFLARVHVKEADPDRAVACSTEARDLLIELCTHDPDNADHTTSLQAARLTRSEALASTGLADEAEAERAASRAIGPALLAK